MKCPECGGNMHREKHVDDTGKADASFYTVWECEDCGYETDEEETCGAMDRF